MPNAPFQVAFWALLFALGTIITISVTDPNGMPLTAMSGQPVNDQEQEPTLASSEPTPAATSLSLEDLQPTLDPAYAQPTMLSRNTPIQVASADPNARLNLEPLTNGHPAPRPITNEQVAMNIPVPIPVPEMYRGQYDEPTTEAALPSQEKMATLVAKAVNLDQWSESIVKRQQSSFDQISKKIDSTTASLRSDISELKATSEPTEEGTIDISITPGTSDDRLTFDFQKAELSEVFRTLGEHAGWTVVVAPEIQGKMTATFTDADPKQAFAVVVKNNRCTVNWRGDYILVSPRQ